jgi:hypothetical protein
MHKSKRPSSIVWPLVKVAGFWFIFAQSALSLSDSLDISPVRSVYFASVAFALHSIVVLVRTFIVDGFSWRLFFGAAVSFAVGMEIFSPFPLMGDYSVGSGRLFRNITAGHVRPVDHLAAAARLIFVKETQQSLAEARRHLLSIPQPAAEYKSAQALLHVAQTREDDVKIRKGARANERASIEIIESEQMQRGLQVTLRNNGKTSVRNIRYHVTYFRVADGWHIGPDKESLITVEIPPHETWTLKLYDKNLVKDLVYGSFTLVNWEFGPES